MIRCHVHCCFPMVCCIAVFASIAAASEYRECDTFAPVVERVIEYSKEFGGDRVLVVMDIDNTLLAMDRDLGSDQWFEWQEYLLDAEPNSPQLVAKDFPKLLEAQGLLFAAYPMHPPEPGLPAQVAAMQLLDVDTLVLTSRGDDFRASTLRELKRAGYDFSKSSPAIRLFEQRGDKRYETGSRFVPYVFDSLEDFGLTEHDAELYSLPVEPREVSYADGVLMTSGQHKGAMMLMFLHLAPRDYDAVVYVDDHVRHVSRVYDALVRRGVEITTFRYSHEDDRVKQFAYGDKSDVTRQWHAIEDLLEGETESPIPAAQESEVAEPK